MKTQFTAIKLSIIKLSLIKLSLKQFLQLFFTISGFLTLIFINPAVLADEIKAPAGEIKVPVGQQSPENYDVERPKRGMTKGQVEKRYGEPQRMVSAVGEPPISSWEYADYTVYFEYDRVIHTVLK